MPFRLKVNSFATYKLLLSYIRHYHQEYRYKLFGEETGGDICFHDTVACFIDEKVLFQSIVCSWVIVEICWLCLQCPFQWLRVIRLLKVLKRNCPWNLPSSRLHVSYLKMAAVENFPTGLFDVNLRDETRTKQHWKVKHRRFLL